MRVSTNLLKQFGHITGSDEEIIESIREHIGEVDYYHNLADDYQDIVIAEIVKKEDHPNADKLAVYQINYGEEDSIQVVAGDKKLTVGDKVTYMKVGSVIPYTVQTEEKPQKIKSIKLRGIQSNGMLGSAKELNVGTDHESVLVLPKDAPVGEKFSKYYDLDDTIVEIENKALTNRGDLFGILGLSRELTAISGKKFNSPGWYLSDSKDLKPETSCLNIQIINDAEAICHRYTAIALDNIKVQESPIWLKSILIKCGIKPVNNIVDITNYISILIGQPLHAFDFDKLIKNDPNSKDTANINIRMAETGEKMLALDDKLYELDETIMVIADSSHPIAIAGVIGGKDTEVQESTTRIVLESANFDKSSVRKTSMKLGIFTEAATRFKHDLDPKQCIPGLKKAVEIMQEVTGGKIASKIVDIYHQEHKAKTIQIDPRYASLVLGVNIPTEEIVAILQNLEYVVERKKVKGKFLKAKGGKSEEYLYVTPPSWRKDINIKEDVYEDIGRIYGFNNIDIKLPKKEIKPPEANRIVEIKKKIREILSNSGANEMITYSFTDSDSFKNCNLDNNLAYKVKNALSPELSLMRTCILQSLLSKGKENIQRGKERFVTYEMNIAHLNNYIHKDKLPIEHWYLGLLLTDTEIDTSTSPFYSVKKYLEKIFNTLGIYNAQYELIANSEEINLPTYIKNILGIFDPNASAIVSVEGVKLGVVGEIRRDVQENHKLPKYTGGMEINIDELTKIKPENKKYNEKPKYPAFTQDVCFEMSVEHRYSEIKDEIVHILEKEKLWNSVECVDIYQDPKEVEKKRITYRITASDYNKTLTDKEIKDILTKITDTVVKKYDAVLV
jgi:phenylalanyl-tRNA synthetase beta chain